MYVVVCQNKKSGAEFTHEFTSPYFMRKFLNKAKRSKTIRIISYPDVD